MTAPQIVAHLVGDYLLQSDWMAEGKTKRWGPAIAHALVYGIPFLLLGSPPAVLVIVATHAVIDRWRLARFVVWAKNRLAPPCIWRTWRECSATGYPPERPVWLATWLLIIADNTLHVVVNAAALDLLP